MSASHHSQVAPGDRPRSSGAWCAIVLAVLAAVVGAPAASAAPFGSAAPRPGVVVSVAPLGWLVDRLAADAVELTVMLPPNAEVETYEPTPQQMRALAGCGLYVAVGHPLFALETAYVEPILARQPATRRIGLGAALASRPGDAAGDPHAWMSLRVLRQTLPGLARELAALLPAEAATIGERERRLAAEIDALDAEIGAQLARAAAERGRRFLVLHPAFGFLAADYGLVQVALEHEGKEPSPRQLAQVIAAARSGGARVVLVTRGTPPRPAEVVARELGGRLVEVDPLARDWPVGLRAIVAALAEALYR